MSDADNRWMPPSPHREKILEEIAAGAAHIFERGHGVPPLLVFEDGGMIELPRVRLQLTRRGMQLTASDEPASRGETRFYDVCGTVDEILGQVREGREPDPEEMSGLLGDIGYMLGRLQRRGEQYAAFFDAVRETVEAAGALQRPAYASAGGRLEALKSSLADKARPLDAEAVTERAECVRALAQASEDYLAECRSAAMRIGTLFGEIRGGRNWQPEQDATVPSDATSSTTGVDPHPAETGATSGGSPDGSPEG